MIEFFVDHPELAALIIGVLIDVAFTIVVLIRSFRSKKSIDSSYVDSIVDQALPGYICLAEQSCSDGVSKLQFVVSLALKKISKYISKSDEHLWISKIIEKVEAILATPQKKG